MDAIINFFQSFGNVISSIFDIVWTFLSDILTIAELLARFLGQIPSFFSWLPSSVVTLLVSIFAVVVLYKIAGREG